MKNYYLSQYSKSILLILIGVFTGLASFGAGLLFHVNIGSFETELEADALTGYDYVITKKAEGELLYQVGEFENYLYAQRATNELKNRGFENSTVSASFNETSISMDDAFVLLENQNQADAEKYNEVYTMSVEDLNKKLDVATTFYVVQIGVFSKKKNTDAYDLPFRVDEVITEKGTYKYQSHEFKSLEDAREAQKLALKNGIEGAFVATYRNGKRVAITSK